MSKLPEGRISNHSWADEFLDLCLRVSDKMMKDWKVLFFSLILTGVDYLSINRWCLGPWNGKGTSWNAATDVLGNLIQAPPSLQIKRDQTCISLTSEDMTWYRDTRSYVESNRDGDSWIGEQWIHLYIKYFRLICGFPMVDIKLLFSSMGR